MARAVKLRSLATFEFLVEQDAGDQSDFAFIEANARLQVEHTVTEEVTGIDLVRTQFDIAAGTLIATEAGALLGPIRDGQDPLAHGNLVVANNEIFDNEAPQVQFQITPEALDPKADSVQLTIGSQNVLFETRRRLPATSTYYRTAPRIDQDQANSDRIE